MLALKEVDNYFPLTLDENILVEHPGVASLHLAFQLDWAEFRKLASIVVVDGCGKRKKMVSLYPRRGFDWTCVLLACGYEPAEAVAVVAGMVEYGRGNLRWLNFSLSKKEFSTARVPAVEHIRAMWDAPGGAGISPIMAAISRKIGSPFEIKVSPSKLKRKRASEEQTIAATGDASVVPMPAEASVAVAALCEVSHEAIELARHASEAADSTASALAGELYSLRLELEESKMKMARLCKHVQDNCIDVTEIAEAGPRKKLARCDSNKIIKVLDALERKVGYDVFEISVGKRKYIRMPRTRERHAEASVKTRQRNRAKIKHVQRNLNMKSCLSADETRSLMAAAGFGVKAAQRVNTHFRSLGFDGLISPAKEVAAADADAEVKGVGVYETTLPGGNEAEGIKRAAAIVITQDALQLCQLELDRCLDQGDFKEFDLGGYGAGKVYIMESQDKGQNSVKFFLRLLNYGSSVASFRRSNVSTMYLPKHPLQKIPPNDSYDAWAEALEFAHGWADLDLNTAVIINDRTSILLPSQAVGDSTLPLMDASADDVAEIEKHRVGDFIRVAPAELYEVRAKCRPDSAVILVHREDSKSSIIGGRCEREDGGYYYFSCRDAVEMSPDADVAVTVKGIVRFIGGDHAAQVNYWGMPNQASCICSSGCDCTPKELKAHNLVAPGDRPSDSQFLPKRTSEKQAQYKAKHDAQTRVKKKPVRGVTESMLLPQIPADRRMPPVLHDLMGATNKDKKSVDGICDKVSKVDPQIARRRDDLALEEADIQKTLEADVEHLESLLNQYAETEQGIGTEARRVVEDSLRAIADGAITLDDLEHELEDGGPYGHMVSVAVGAIESLREQAESKRRGDHRRENAGRRSRRQVQQDEAAADEMLVLATEIEEVAAELRDGPSALEATKQELLALTSADGGEAHSELRDFWNKCIEEVGVVQQKYWIGQMNGGDCWKLLRNIKNIFAKLKTKMVEMELSEEYNELELNWLPRFEALGVIARYGRKTGFCNEAEIELFCAACAEYGNLVRSAGETLTPKQHDIEDHFPRFMRQYKTLYLFTEEGDESTHHEMLGAATQARSIRDPKARARATLRIFERKQRSAHIKKKQRTDN